MVRGGIHVLCRSGRIPSMCQKLLCLLFKHSITSLFSVLHGKCHLDSSGEGFSLMKLAHHYPRTH